MVRRAKAMARVARPKGIPARAMAQRAPLAVPYYHTVAGGKSKRPIRSRISKQSEAKGEKRAQGRAPPLARIAQGVLVQQAVQGVPANVAVGVLRPGPLPVGYAAGPSRGVLPQNLGANRVAYGVALGNSQATMAHYANLPVVRPGP